MSDPSAGDPTGEARGGVFRPLRTWLLGVIDRALPHDVLDGAALPLRRARLTVAIGAIAVLYYTVLGLILLVLGMALAAGIAVAGAVVTLGGLLWQRVQGYQPGLSWGIMLLLTGMPFVQSVLDAGIADPILVWVAVAPLAGALMGGPRMSAASAFLAVLGMLGLIAATVAGVTFPHHTTPEALAWSAFVSVTGGALFAVVAGWFYDYYTRQAFERMDRRARRLEGALGSSEERYKQLVDNIALGVYRTTPGGRVELANPALLRMTGYASVAELDAAGMRGIYVDPAHRLNFQQLAARDEAVRGFETVWKTRTGQERHVRIDARAIRDAAGVIVAYEGVVEDVTAAHRVRAALRRSEARFRALVQRASDVIVVLDAAGHAVYVSPVSRQMLGLDPAALVHRSPLALVHPDDRAGAAEAFRALLASDAAERVLEVRLRHREGHYVYTEVAVSNLLRESAVQGLVLALRDVTERKRAEAVLVRGKEQAEEVARLKSTFLANMSHEIRTPLTGILGFADILAEEVTDPEQQEFVALIARAGRRLMDTLNSVLDLARLEAGRVELALEPVALGALVTETTSVLVPLACERGLLLEANVAAPDALAAVDAGALGRVLNNLVGNAIKFTKTGRVSVSVLADDAYVYLCVADTGIGMGDEFLQRLFGEFEQESTGLGRSHEGSGLGLAITRQLVERMRGTISVESQRGVGTTFTVAFPRLAPDPSAPPDTPGVSDAHETAGASGPRPAPALVRALPRLLVVDDSEQALDLVSRLLRGRYDVEIARTLDEALARAKEMPMDGFLLDIHLGASASGTDLVARLRATPAYADVPCVAFTAYGLPGDRERFLNAGFDEYLVKPFTQAQLVEALRAGFARRAPGAVPPAPRLVPTPLTLLVRAPERAAEIKGERVPD